MPRGAAVVRLSGLMDMGWGSAVCLWGATPLGPRAAPTERRASDRSRLGEGGSLFFQARCAWLALAWRLAALRPAPEDRSPSYHPGTGSRNSKMS